MTLKFKLFILSILSSCMSGLLYPAAYSAVLPSSPLVRVLLLEEKNEDFNVVIHSAMPFSIRMHNDAEQRWYRYKVEKKEVAIECKKDIFTLNGKRFSSASFEVVPALNHRLKYKDKEYEGTFIMYKSKNRVLLINQLPLENYVYSVLKSESWPGWPLEVNMAFAIACRSYVVAKVLESRKKKLAYDIKNTNIHQTYHGFHTEASLKEAVNLTQHCILTYKDRPIVAMFDCCCGGVVPAHMQGVNFKSAPYLARQKACTYCKDSKLYEWKLEIEQKDLENLLRAQGIKVTALHDIIISKKDKAGIVHEVMVHTKEHITPVSAKKLYSWIKPLKSSCYKVVVHKRSKKVFVNGFGYGHHLGLCQWGARGMVARGYNYQAILNFYYPDTHLKKLVVV